MKHIIQGMMLVYPENDNTSFYYKILNVTNGNIEYKVHEIIGKIDEQHICRTQENDFIKLLKDGSMKIYKQKINWKNKLR